MDDKFPPICPVAEADMMRMKNLTQQAANTYMEGHMKTCEYCQNVARWAASQVEVNALFISIRGDEDNVSPN